MNNIKCYSLFLKVFVDGIIIGKINYYEIIKFLEKHTWFGTKFKRTIALKDIDETTTWISYLSPGIHNLFSQFELSVLMNSNKINNFILCIDSLTLKFEGVLRDFILLSGGNTTKWLEGNIQEQLFSDLIDNPTISQYFNENDIESTRLLSNKLGIDEFEVDPSDRWNEADESIDTLRPTLESLVSAKDIVQRKFETTPNRDFVIDPKCKNNIMHFISSDGYYSPCCYSKHFDFHYNSQWHKNKEDHNIKTSKLSDQINVFNSFYATIQTSRPDYCLFNCGKL
jgi:hypothetical protein